MAFRIALVVTAVLSVLSVRALGEETCNAQSPEKCLSDVGSEQVTQGNVLLQVDKKFTKSHSSTDGQGFDTDDTIDPKLIQESFSEMEKHAQAMIERLQLVQEEHSQVADKQPEAEERVRKALAMFQQAEKEIKKARDMKHTGLIQGQAKTGVSRASLIATMKSVRKLAKEAEGIVSQVNDAYLQTNPDQALLQEVEESEEDEEEEEENLQANPDEGLLQEVEESEEEEAEDELENEDGEEEDDISEIQTGEGVQYEDDEEKTIERH